MIQTNKGGFVVKNKKSSRNKKTFDSLANALRKLMEKKNIEMISVNEISALAGLHRITFYYYFQDKYDLLDYVFNDDIDNIFNANDFKSIVDFIIELFKYLDEHCGMYNNAFASDGYQSLKRIYLKKSYDFLENVIAQMTNNNFLVKKEHIIEFYSLAATEFIINWLKKKNREDYQLVAKEMIFMIEHGLIKSIGK